MGDPLTLLRQYNIQRQTIGERDDQITFNTLSFLKTAKTNYVIGSIGRTSQTKEYYTLEALLFLLKNVHLSHPIYVQRAGAANVPVVRFPDRKELLSYLNGEKETTNNIDKSAPLELPLSRVATVGTKRTGEEAVASAKKQKLATEDSQQKQENIQEWLSKKLGKKMEGAVTKEKIMKDGTTGAGLNEVMSFDRIAEIKRKIMTRKRATIKGDDEQDMPQVASEGQQPQPEQATFLGDPENDMSKDILSRERKLRTRTSVLQSNGKQFLQNIQAILTSIKAIEDGKAAPATAEKPAPAPAVKPEPVKKSTAVHRYDRYDQERFDSQKDTTEGFKINTMATFTNKSEAKSPRKTMPSPSHSSSGAPDKSPKNSSKSSSKPEKRQPKTPIIIVPASGSALVTLHNIKEFLQDYKFVSVEEKKRQGVVKETEVLIQRKKEVVLNGQMQAVTVPFRVIDQPLKLTTAEWNRVAAVFLQGPAWQFKGWPSLLPDGSPVEIFTKIKAYYVHFEGMKIDPNVLKWDVFPMTINQTRRHKDRASVMKFWESLEKFLTKNKPNLRF